MTFPWAESAGASGGPDLKLEQATIGWAYFDDGYAAGKLAVRVLRGESPATMAFEPLTKTELLVNKATAEAIGVTLPEQLLKEAKEVVS
jgi:putative ABC transport system substrate-binding protein